MSIPIVMLAGMAFRPHKRLAKKLGTEGYLTKPFDLEVLTEMVKQYEPVTVSTVS